MEKVLKSSNSGMSRMLGKKCQGEYAEQRKSNRGMVKVIYMWGPGMNLIMYTFSLI
jgi:hypothetical protein